MCMVSVERMDTYFIFQFQTSPFNGQDYATLTEMKMKILVYSWCHVELDGSLILLKSWHSDRCAIKHFHFISLYDGSNHKHVYLYMMMI